MWVSSRAAALPGSGDAGRGPRSESLRCVAAQHYKERFSVEPNIGAVYGYVSADLTVLGLERAGPDLAVDSLITGLESIKGYHDIFNGPEQNFGPDKHQGASSSFLAVVKNGRWVRLTDPLVF
jgi:branched-chain amino acid transport system substrate-binding protein